ncbi:Xanthine/uracil/vitamin C permease [Trinorchestia longiramus]|nr:Xanthine/uracil/vitamin C permease [Trinorchestia longiramus]
MCDNPAYIEDKDRASPGYSPNNPRRHSSSSHNGGRQLPSLSSILSEKEAATSGALPTLSSILNNKEQKPQLKNSGQTSDAASFLKIENAPDYDNPQETSENRDDDDDDGADKLLYSIEENPPWYLALCLGLQHFLTMVGGTVTIPYVLTPALCILPHDPARGAILGTIFFVSGIVTFLQSTFGTRLPIIQGGTFAFFVPTFAILHTSFASCESLNLTMLTEEQQQEEWQLRMREVQGAIMVSSLFQILIGFTGLIGLLVSFITPLAIVPTVSLIGLSLFDVAVDKASKHWGISFMTIALLILFSQYLRNISLPIPTYSKQGVRFIKVQIFGLFPVLLAILLSWATCGILTATGALSEDSHARTDKSSDLIANSPWVRVPYPGQWGTPTVSAAGVFGMLAGVLASILESIGDYYACARLSGAPPPPRHAINRGIGMEGLGCLLAGVWGTCNGTTSYSENIGAIGLTKVGSRRVIQFGAAVMVLVGILSKFCAMIVTIPEPVVGGIFCVMFAMITAVGISSIQYVDLNSSRNLFVLGFPIFFGLALSKWLEEHPDAIHSEAVPALTQIVTVLLKTSMFVGGFLGVLLDNTIPGVCCVRLNNTIPRVFLNNTIPGACCVRLNNTIPRVFLNNTIPGVCCVRLNNTIPRVFLNNTIPGTDKERGLVHWKKQMDESEGEATEVTSKTYDFPFGMTFIRRISFFEKVPFCPTFKSWTFKKTT